MELKFSRSIMHLDPKKLEGVLRSCGHENLLLTGREGSQLEEVVNILLFWKQLMLLKVSPARCQFLNC
jgi:hypothetical protein